MTTQEDIPTDGSKRLYVNLCPACSFVHHTETEHLASCGACGYGDESPLTLEKEQGEWKPRPFSNFTLREKAVHARQSTPSADLGETGVSFPVISGLSYQP